tara:strand:- start:512 stop:739 length:228 start_codon:yes stop_codon:yes gene_type:complete
MNKHTKPLKPDPAPIRNQKYFNIWDRSDVLPLSVLKSIRQSDYLSQRKNPDIIDNNDPRTCDMRLNAMQTTKRGY